MIESQTDKTRTNKVRQRTRRSGRALTFVFIPSVLALALALVALCSPALCQEARFSLKLREVPLSRVLMLLEQTAGVRFHYAAPLDAPDAVVSAEFQDASLSNVLRTLLGRAGFQFQREGNDICVFRTLSPTTWRYWDAPVPPPAQWTQPQAKQVKVLPSASPTILGLSTELSSDAENYWKPVSLKITPSRRPSFGVNPFSDSSHQTSDRQTSQIDAINTDDAPAAPVWLRWPITLRHVPHNAQLLLETPVSATLYVNGAPLLRHWKGRRLLDLSRALQRGNNCIAIHWSQVPASVTSITSATSTTPLLRYEWLFADPVRGSKPNATVVKARPQTAPKTGTKRRSP